MLSRSMAEDINLRRLRISHLPPLSESDVRKMFSPFGMLESVQVQHPVGSSASNQGSVALIV
jgi:hypothetical protein